MYAAAQADTPGSALDAEVAEEERLGLGPQAVQPIQGGAPRGHREELGVNPSVGAFGFSRRASTTSVQQHSVSTMAHPRAAG